MPQYTVQPGETLSQIARKYGISDYNTIKTRSGNPNLIRVGEVLEIPGQQPAPVYQPPLSETDQKKQEIAKLRADLDMAQGQLANAQAAGYSGKTEIPGNVLGASSPEEAKIAGLENVAFAQPTKTSTELYNELYAQGGLKDIQAKVDEISGNIAEKKKALSKEEASIMGNPWLSEASRVGRVKNLYEMAQADIQTDLDTQKLYQEQLDRASKLIQSQAESQIEKEESARKSAKDYLDYLTQADKTTKPTSYNEWDLAGGAGGTGMSYAKWLDRNKGELTATERATEVKKAAIAKAQTYFQNFINQMQGQPGWDGFLYDTDYLRLRNDFATAIGDASLFDEVFAPMLSPVNRAKYGVGKAVKTETREP
jgi:LysM repeat protein